MLLICWHVCSYSSYTFGYIVLLCDAVFPDGKSNILANIARLKSELSDLIEPDFGLLDHLLSLHVLTLQQFVDVRSEEMVCSKNDTLLDLLTSKDKCEKFLKALQRTRQQHVVNFVVENGGQRMCSHCF